MRPPEVEGIAAFSAYFPTFGWGLSLRRKVDKAVAARAYRDFPTFGWGLSLRLPRALGIMPRHFISPPSGGDFH